jgi:inositol-pentakisphosphate 2-kinase
MLLDTSVLRLLSNLQRTLDPLDIEGLSLLWSRAQATASPGVALSSQLPDDGAPPAPPLGEGLQAPTIDEWQKFLDIYLAKNFQMDHDHPDVANLRYYCLAYLLSASFKDCSIILRVPEEGKNSITVIDLDVKPIDRLRKWEQLDQQIVEAYKQAWKPRQCVPVSASG